MRRVSIGFGAATCVLLGAVVAQAITVQRYAPHALAVASLVSAFILVALGLSLAATLVLRLLRNVAYPLARVSGSVESIAFSKLPRFMSTFRAFASGNLQAPVETIQHEPLTQEADDEIGVLVRSYNALGEALSSLSSEYSTAKTNFCNVMKGIVVATRDIENVGSAVGKASELSIKAAREISTSVGELAASTRAQFMRVQSAQASSEEMARAAAQIAQGALEQARAVQAATEGVSLTHESLVNLGTLGQNLARSAGAAVHEAANGLSEGRLAAVALEAVSKHSHEAVASMEGLVGRTAAVGDILEAIGDIAEQTNLLALNAAIEAARAGDQGRGFAVVASEIRKLAERARSSTAEIDAILSMIREETTTTAEILRTSNRSTEDGLARARSAAGALETAHETLQATIGSANLVQDGVAELLETSEKLDAEMRSVLAIVDVNTTAAQEMRVTTEFIGQAMLDISIAAEEQAAASEQIASSAACVTEEMEEMEHSAGVIAMRSSNVSFLTSGFQFEAMPAVPALRSLPAGIAGPMRG